MSHPTLLGIWEVVLTDIDKTKHYRENTQLGAT